jgi:hypothetical protein
MLLTIQQLDKLAAARTNFVECGMVDPSQIPLPSSDKYRDQDDDDGGDTDEL